MTALEHAANRYFATADDELMVGRRKLTAIAREIGRTPFYAYDRSILDRRVAELRAVLPATVRLHYAIKANPMPAVVAHMVRRVDGLDVASGRELAVALGAGADVREVSFAGPAKSSLELEQAVAAGILINIESFREIRILRDIARGGGRRPRVAVRVNPDFELKLSGLKMGGGPKQFGIDAEDVPRALEEVGRAGIDFEGFHIFSGSQNLRVESICEALSNALELAIRLSASAPAPVLSVNLGGGFGIPYFPGDEPLDLSAIGAHLRGVVDKAAQKLGGASIVIELGRFLVGEAGVYVCRVVDRKVSRGRVFLVTDGGLHHHLAASGNFGQVIRKNYPLAIGNRVRGDRREIATVVGPLCTPLDLLGDQVEVAEAHEGDLVVVFQSGAYGLTASPTAFLSHPQPAELLV